VRVGAGASFADAPENRLAAAGDLGAGLRLYKVGTNGPFGHIALDYAYADNIASPHSLALGTGLGYRLGTLGVSLTPRLVVGLSESSVGTRPGIALDWLSFAYAEVAYQYLPDDAGPDHSVRLTAGIDIGVLLYILFTPPEIPHQRGR
jgi:hypothetical protein